MVWIKRQESVEEQAIFPSQGVEKSEEGGLVHLDVIDSAAHEVQHVVIRDCIKLLLGALILEHVFYFLLGKRGRRDLG